MEGAVLSVFYFREKQETAGINTSSKQWKNKQREAVFQKLSRAGIPVLCPVVNQVTL